MRSSSVFLRGPGWRLPSPLDLSDPIEVREVARDRPEELPALLGWLDEVAGSRRPDRIAAGFLTYEAGVALEGSRDFFRPPSTCLAWFGLFEIATGPGSEPPASPAPEPGGAGETGGEPSASPGPEPTSDLDVAGWTAAVAELRAGIARGDVYQANLTRRTTDRKSVV